MYAMGADNFPIEEMMRQAENDDAGLYGKSFIPMRIHMMTTIVQVPQETMASAILGMHSV